MHYGNTLHRLKMSKNSSRLNFKGEFSAKTKIILGALSVEFIINGIRGVV